jgi:hemerythrin HHE cation binding domain-containing protein
MNPASEHWIARTIKQTADEHSELLAKTRAIESLVEGMHYPPPGDVARKLRALAEHLAAHIDEEEKSPLYTTVPEKVPELRDEIALRRGEHVPLMIALRQLTVEAERAHDASMASALGMRIRSAVAAVRQHEAGESSILHRLRELDALD